MSIYVENKEIIFEEIKMMKKDKTKKITMQCSHILPRNKKKNEKAPSSDLLSTFDRDRKGFKLTSTSTTRTK